MLFSDLRTVVAITGLMGCLMSIILYALKRTYPKSIKGLGEWAVFPTLSFIASALYGMQGSWHHLVSMALPNLLLVITLITFSRGTHKHFGVDENRWFIYSIIVVALVFNLWTSGKNEYYVYRLAFVSGLTALIFGTQLKVLWMHRHGSFATHLMLLTIAWTCTVMLVRMVSSFIDPPSPGIYNFSPVQAIYLVTYGFGILLLSISAVLLSFEQLRKELEKLLKYDALTGALTRRAALEYGQDLVPLVLRRSTTFSVLLMDLDHFKQINDVYGHQVGDKVLAEFVQSVEQITRRPAALGRYGGEEFILLLPDTSQEQAVLVAHRIQAQLRASAQLPRVTVSIGVATFLPSKGDTLDAVIGRADAALYRAKNNGRDRVEADSPPAGIQASLDLATV